MASERLVQTWSQLAGGRTCAMTTTRPPRRAPPPPREQITSVYGVIYFTDFSTFGTKLNGCVRESVGGGWRCHEREHRRSLPPPPTRCLLRPPPSPTELAARRWTRTHPWH